MVQAKRRTKAQKHRRASHFALIKPTSTKVGVSLHRRHFVDMATGNYKGEVVLPAKKTLLGKKTTKTKKAK